MGIYRDEDDLGDGVETNTGVFVSASDTGTSPAQARSIARASATRRDVGARTPAARSCCKVGPPPASSAPPSGGGSIAWGPYPALGAGGAVVERLWRRGQGE